MNIQDIKTYIRIKEELTDLCSDILYYVKRKYIEQLTFGRYSAYNKYFITDTSISIEYYDYGYDLYDYDWLPDIPLELLESESSWQQFLDDCYEKKIKEEEERKTKEEQAKEDKERELYKKLKEKFEDETI